MDNNHLVLTRKSNQEIVIYAGQERIRVMTDRHTKLHCFANPQVRIVRAELEQKPESEVGK